ncbi:MAG: hypothetical protein ACI4NV_09335 [Thermoguttaceae bacterium]
MPNLPQNTETEVLILRNPIAYKDIAPDAFQELIKDGTWIPLVFGVLKAVIDNHFFDLCELNWDYVENVEKVPAHYLRTKTLFSANLSPEQETFIQKIATEIEEELKIAAQETLENKRNEGNDEVPDF